MDIYIYILICGSAHNIKDARLIAHMLRMKIETDVDAWDGTKKSHTMLIKKI